jgi:hydroxypyruvate isomerase
MKYSICHGAYPDKDIVYHLEKAKQHGFQGVEYYNWSDYGDLHELAKHIERIGVRLNSTCTRFFNLVDPSFRDKYMSELTATIEACHILGIRSIITQTGNARSEVTRDMQQKAMIQTLKQCAPLLEKAQITLELEPLNGLVDHVGHFLQRSDEAVMILDQVDSPFVKLVFDVYHQQVTEGNVTRNAVQYIERINHFHIADNPGRKQPGTGELNYVHILQAIQATGFDGFIGLECGYTIDTDMAIEQFKQNILSHV